MACLIQAVAVGDAFFQDGNAARIIKKRMVDFDRAIHENDDAARGALNHEGRFGHGGDHAIGVCKNTTCHGGRVYEIEAETRER